MSKIEYKSKISFLIPKYIKFYLNPIFLPLFEISPTSMQISKKKVNALFQFLKVRFSWNVSVSVQSFFMLHRVSPIMYSDVWQSRKTYVYTGPVDWWSIIQQMKFISFFVNHWKEAARVISLEPLNLLFVCA